MNEFDKIPSRTQMNKELYNNYGNQSYDKFDINSNQEILKDNARKINVNQVREMLEEKYSDNAPKRRSIEINVNEVKHDDKEDTKEYDLKEILSKAKNDINYDYDYRKLNKASDINKIVDDVRNKYPKQKEPEEREELVELIKTVTRLEIENSNKDAELLGLEETTEIQRDSINEEKEEEFYTGNLKVEEKDFEDFKDIEDSIKSNSLLIKILIFIFILVAIAIGVVVANSLFELGLF